MPQTEETALRQQPQVGEFEGALTAEQRELLALVGAGLSVAEAAWRLHLSTRTAERRLAAARRLLGANTNAQAALCLTGQAIATHGGNVTTRQRQVLALIAAGLRDREIAERLGVSPSTVASLVGSAMATLDARSRTQAAARLAEIDDVRKSGLH